MNIPKLLTPDEVADILGVSTSTLAIWRCVKSYQLPYIKAGRLIRYEDSDVVAFITARKHDGVT